MPLLTKTETVKADILALTQKLHGGSSKYNAAGKVARDALTGRTPAWVITDGGLE